MSNANHHNLILENISIRAKNAQQWLINDLSCDIAPQEILGIVGDSGAGKSTLLHYIAGFENDDFEYQGNIILHHQMMNSTPAWQRNIALLFQDDCLFPHLSIGQNLAIALPEKTPKKQRDEMICWACAQAQLQGFEDRDPATLSGGQRQRIAVMRCVLSQPKALLLDEAFSKLDPNLKQEFRSFIATQIKKANICALLVSHDANDMNICDRVIRL